MFTEIKGSTGGVNDERPSCPRQSVVHDDIFPRDHLGFGYRRDICFAAPSRPMMIGLIACIVGCRFRTPIVPELA